MAEIEHERKTQEMKLQTNLERSKLEADKELKQTKMKIEFEKRKTEARIKEEQDKTEKLKDKQLKMKLKQIRKYKLVGFWVLFMVLLIILAFCTELGNQVIGYFLFNKN